MQRTCACWIGMDRPVGVHQGAGIRVHASTPRSSQQGLHPETVPKLAYSVLGGLQTCEQCVCCSYTHVHATMTPARCHTQP